MSQFVVAITVAVDDDGTEATQYFTDGPGFCTTPSDTPAETWVQPRLLDPGSYRRELVSGNKLWGAVRPSFGEVVLANSDGALDAWLGYGVDGRAVAIYWGDPDDGAFPDDWTVVLKCYGHSLVADFDAIRLRLRDRLVLMEQPVCTELFAGTGGLEGEDANAVKPRLLGLFQWPTGWWSLRTHAAPMTLLDDTKLVYHVCEEETVASGMVYEGGLGITNGADYSTASDLVTVAPSPGTARWYRPSGGPTYVRLGSTPANDVRASTYATDYLAGASFAQLAGITATADPPLGWAYVDDGATSYLDCAEAVAQIALSWFGMSRLDVYQCELLAVPGETAEYTFTAHNAYGFQRTPIAGLNAPIGRATREHGQVWPHEPLGGASWFMKSVLRMTGYVSRLVYNNSSALTKHPTAPTLELKSRYFATGTWASVGALFGVERDMLSFTAPFAADTLALELHDTVEVKLPRFGLSDGKMFRIVSAELRLKSREIAFTLWG